MVDKVGHGAGDEFDAGEGRVDVVVGVDVFV